MKKYNCNVGDVFGEWVVLDTTLYRTSNNRAAYECKCSCGNISYIAPDKLFKNRSTKCKKCAGNSYYRGLGDLSGVYFTRIRFGALNRNIEFNISIQYIYDLFISQDGKCILSGIDIILDKSISRRQKGCGIQTASLDRIDSSKGYVEGNVQWVHKDINNMKQSLNEEYFIELCKKITEHNENNRKEI